MRKLASEKVSSEDAWGEMEPVIYLFLCCDHHTPYCAEICCGAAQRVVAITGVDEAFKNLACEVLKTAPKPKIAKAKSATRLEHAHTHAQMN